jgi:hypothetical protein
MPAVLVPLGPDAERMSWSILDLGDVVTWEELAVDLPELEERVFPRQPAYIFRSANCVTSPGARGR